MRRDEGDEENGEEKETIGNRWEKWRDENTPDDYTTCSLVMNGI